MNLFRFLRSQKEYDPPEDIRKIIMKIANNTVNQTKISYELDKTEKFRFLKKCEEIVDHKVPNSLLYTVKTLGKYIHCTWHCLVYIYKSILFFVGDVYEFYETPVDTVVPYEALQQQELPPNLHIISNYQRFHPDTDLMFEGVTAFPRSSNLVTGLKTKKKYTGFTTLSPYHSKD